MQIRKLNQKSYRKAVFIVVYKIEKNNKNNKISYLLLKRKLHWKGWEFPKGGIDGKESTKQAALRETQEESGLKPLNIISFKIKGKYKYHKLLKDRPNKIGQTYQLFACQVKLGKVKFDKKLASRLIFFNYCGESVRRIYAHT